MNYKIVEKTLYLNIDYNYEFSIDFDLKHKYSNMKRIIKDYIKRISFDGDKVVLTLGGVILAIFLLVENPSINKDLSLVYVNNSAIPKNEIKYVFKEEVVEPIKEEKIEESPQKKVEVKKLEKVETVKKKDEESVYVKEENVSKESEQMVTVYRNNGEVINLDLDDYLIGVVGAEMPASFDLEALKVQAIISRTYALKSIQKGRKLTDTVSTQVYKDNLELKEKWGNDFDKYYSKIKEAVVSTKNIAIYYNNEYIDALFYAATNGKSEDAEYVWGNSVPYLKSVDSIWDKDTTQYERTITKDLKEVLNILGVDNSNFNILNKDGSGRVLELSFGGKIFTGVEFRTLLGLRSTDFNINIEDNKIEITTYGYGHGVGVSQYGSNEMAKKGYNCYDIIKYYYTGVDIH